MPIFDFTCKQCKLTEEVLISLSDLTSIRECGECGGTMLREVSTPYIHCVGLGVYKPKAGEPK